jgi:Carbohydrate-selective porin, OprB family/S-layer homology domain
MNSNKFQLSWLFQPVFVGLLASGSLLLAGSASANELNESSSSAALPTASTNLPAAPVESSNPAALPAASTNLPVAPAGLPATFSTLVTDVNSTTEAGQVTSVSQLSDVQPTDWAFQALQSLVERYGCIAGYPDGTFRGNRAATRYELAAALNACLDQISDRFATKEDLAAVQALQEEFKAELATLKGRVDGLEARTKTLEAQQFSTTTKLSGEVIFAGAETFTDNDKRAVATGTPTVPLNSRFFSAYRVRLNFDTSFTGEDRLRVRLQARDAASVNTSVATNMGRLGFDGSNTDGTAGQFTLDDLWYRFPIGKKAKVTVIARSGEFNDFVGDTFNPYLASSGTGALSRFGRFNPIYRFGDNGSESAGVVANYKFNDQFSASIGYLAPRPTNSVGPRGGLFGGSYAALAQLEIKPTKNLGIGLTYVHALQEGIGAVGATPADNALLDLTGGTGSARARRPFGNNPMESDSAGLQFSWKVAKWLNLSGWGGVTFAERTNANSSATVLNWAVAAAFPDLLIPGNVGAIIVGQEPRLIGGSAKPACNTVPRNADCGSNFHIEGLYKFKINGNVSITPGLIVIINPENNESNGVEFVPVIRTTFTF